MNYFHRIFVGGFFIYIKNNISPFDNPPMLYYSYGYEVHTTNSPYRPNRRAVYGMDYKQYRRPIICSGS